MDVKHSCVIDAAGKYITLVLQRLTTQPDGAPVWQVQEYTLDSGMGTIDTPPPTLRIHAGGTGLVSPRWDDTQWGEGATAEDIAAWSHEHPAPPPPPMRCEEAMLDLLTDIDYRLSLQELGQGEELI